PPATGASVIVSSGQQVTVPARADPKEPEAIALSPDDVADFNELQPAVPAPDFSPPDPKGSQRLSAIFSRHTINAGLDLDATPDDGTLAFHAQLLQLLARSWGLKPNITRLRHAQLVKSLTAGVLDVALTPDPSGFTYAETLPLFADSNARVWTLALSKDDVFLASLRRFLRAAVSSGKYAAYYRSS